MRIKPLILSLALSASLLGGCNMFDRNAPTASNYLLAPPAQAKVEGPLLGTIVVRPASAIRPYDNKGFVYKLANGQWRVDGYNGFLAGPPDMIADALMRACEVSGRFNVVTGSGLATQTDLAAETLVEEFFVDFTDVSRPVALVRLRTYVINRRTGRSEVLAMLIGSGSVPLANDSPGAVADALSAATGIAIAQVIAALPADPAVFAGAGG